MKAQLEADVLLLAAGFGKRLGALTEKKPKPLIEIGGQPVIERLLTHLATQGVQRVFINLHYRGDQIKKFVGNGSNWGLEVIYFDEPTILDTGGAIRNVESAMRFRALVTINADIVLDKSFSFSQLISAHQTDNRLATLVLRQTEDPIHRHEVGIDAQGRICSFLGKNYFPVPLSQSLMYAGVQVIALKLFSYMPQRGTVFSITRDTYVQVLESGGYLGSQTFSGYWADIGTPEGLERASKDLESGLY